MHSQSSRARVRGPVHNWLARAGGPALISVLIAAGVLVAALSMPTQVSGATHGVSASPSLLQPGGGAGSSTTAAVITIDADEGAGDLRILASGGRLHVDGGRTPLSCAFAACAGEVVAGLGDVTIPDAGNNLDTLTVTLEGPAVGPATITVVVIQGGVAKSTDVRVRGAASSVQLRALRAASTSATDCQGTDVAVLATGSMPAGAIGQAFLCVVVSDSSGNRLGGQPVIYSASAGSLSALTDMIGPLGERASAVTFAAGGETSSGTIATVTASVGGRSASLQLAFAGAPSRCVVSAQQPRVAAGSSAQIAVAVFDARGNLVPDGISVSLGQVNAGGGLNNVAVLGNPGVTKGGTATFTLMTAINGPIGLGAVVSGSPAVSCSGSLTSGTGASSSGGLQGQPTRPRPESQQYVTVQQASAPALVARNMAARGCTIGSLAMQSQGRWVVYRWGTPGVSNAGFPSVIPARTSVYVRCAG